MQLQPQRRQRLRRHLQPARANPIPDNFVVPHSGGAILTVENHA